MIDIAKEHLVAIRDVPKKLPKRPTGKRVHISAVYRWVQRGIRGVRLESIRIGGTTYTSMEALQRFADERSEPTWNSSNPTISTPASREKEIDRAAHKVERLLGTEPTEKNRKKQ